MQGKLKIRRQKLHELGIGKSSQTKQFQTSEHSTLPSTQGRSGPSHVKL